MSKAWVIYNPWAGRFPAGPLLQRAAAVLAASEWSIEIVETTAEDDLTEVAKRAVKAGCDTVFVAGGDGSVGKVAAGLAGTSASLGVLPAGTANVWAKEIGLPRLGWIHPLALEEAAARLANGQVRRVDLGSAAGHSFMLWAGVGLDGKIVNSIEPRARWEKAFAVAHYAVLAAWETLDWTGMELRVSALDQAWEDRFIVAIASNIRAYAGGFLELSPEARIDDGLFDFWLLRGNSVLDSVGVVPQILAGRHIDSPEVVHFRANKAVFESDSPLPMQFDGEPDTQHERVELVVRPKVLNVLVPAGGWPKLFSDLGSAAQEDLDLV